MIQYKEMMKKKFHVIITVAIIIVLSVVISVNKNSDSFADGSLKGAIQITVIADGHASSVMSPAMDVKTFLELQGIPVGEKDQVNLDQDHILVNGDRLQITRVITKTKVEKEEIAFETEEIEDSSIDKGEQSVETPGQKGEKEVTYQFTYADGKLIEKEPLAEKVVKEAKNEVVKVGTKEAAPKASSTSSTSYPSYGSGAATASSGGRTITVTAVAYCLPGRTALGLPVGRGIIAVDPSVIPLGSRAYVEGYGEAIAADTGGGIYGNKIDVWVPSLSEAYSWGARTVTVTIL